MLTLVGPFRQLLTFAHLPQRGALSDEQLEVISEGGILIEGDQIKAVGTFEDLRAKFSKAKVEAIVGDAVALPSFTDAHTHICFGGSRAGDYAARNAGKTYLEIAKAGGGIWSTVQHTREAEEETLVGLLAERATRLLKGGITTVEVKSGYGLSLESELKMLRAIQKLSNTHTIDVVATCLAAHLHPKDFTGDKVAYLSYILDEILPQVKAQNLASRADIFIEESAFSSAQALPFLQGAKELGFALTVHGDQFTTGGSQVAIETGAVSVDHLEASGEKEIQALAKSKVIPVALPGASLGLGCAFTPARKLLDAGTGLVIASDWNPGSAPQGDLLTQAAILGTFEKLSTAEVLAGITVRSANVLGFEDRGTLESGKKADFLSFPSADYREILYHQGSMRPTQVWKGGKTVVSLK